MDFKKNKIRKDPPKEKLITFNSKQKAQYMTIGGGALAILLLLFGISTLLKNLDFSSIIFSFGQSLKVDENGHTNILLAGTGGEGHDGSDLTDTVIVASIDYQDKLVTMLSIPRDLYIKSKKLGTGERINSIYAIGKHTFNSAEGMEELKNVAGELTGISIDYFVKVDFNGFKKIVDNLEGIEVKVEKDIYDPYYPLGETTKYETFSISAGEQHLDGETALKYARSRKTTSDFDRALRQQQIMTAIKDKALSLNILTDPSKIKKLYDTVNNSIETNLSVNEIIELARLSKDFQKDNIISRVLVDDPNLCGGYLYTPPREDYSGAFVLIPVGKNYDYLHLFTQNIFKNPKIMADQSPIQVLNGTKKTNIAWEAMSFLNRLCFNIVYYGNNEDRNLAESIIYYQPGPKGEKPEILNFITQYFPYKIEAGIPENYLNNERKQGTAIILVLGLDYLENRIKDPFAELPPPKPTTISDGNVTTPTATPTTESAITN